MCGSDGSELAQSASQWSRSPWAASSIPRRIEWPLPRFRSFRSSRTCTPSASSATTSAVRSSLALSTTRISHGSPCASSQSRSVPTVAAIAVSSLYAGTTTEIPGPDMRASLGCSPVTDHACHICEGPLELRHPGDGTAPSPELFVPTNHEPGQHGDLYACAHCGTVHQPGLPSGSELTELYRGMSDDLYLSEEEGRRATARRLIGLIRTHVPAGALLDVGCGHGLLLDEARRSGYSVTGLELSESARGYATEVLGLDVRDETLEQFARTGPRAPSRRSCSRT